MPILQPLPLLAFSFFLLAPAAHDRDAIPDCRLDSDIHSGHSADDRPGYNNCIDFPDIPLSLVLHFMMLS